MPRTLDEQESILRWSPSDKVLTLYTAHPATAKKWRKLGYSLVAMGHEAGVETSWTGEAPASAVKLRRVSGGQVVKRKVVPGGPPGFKRRLDSARIAQVSGTEAPNTNSSRLDLQDAPQTLPTA